MGNEPLTGALEAHVTLLCTSNNKKSVQPQAVDSSTANRLARSTRPVCALPNTARRRKQSGDAAAACGSFGIFDHRLSPGYPMPLSIPAADPRQNGLLAALPAAEWQRWAGQLEWMDLPLGHVLYESGVPLGHVCFPTTAIVSLLYVLDNGASAEIAIVGHEGVVGTSVFLGAESTPSRAVVQSSGEGFRMKAQTIKDEFKHPAVMHLLLRYTQALVTQMSQTAVCNRHHSLDQQLCRWLLLSLDRLSGMELVMTQQLIADMLGVRREGVTEAARKLQNAELIRYARGHILVMDRKGLSRQSRNQTSNTMAGEPMAR
jgi:CRP-like cAMP-binding protein